MDISVVPGSEVLVARGSPVMSSNTHSDRDSSGVGRGRAGEEHAGHHPPRTCLQQGRARRGPQVDLLWQTLAVMRAEGHSDHRLGLG